MLGLMRKQAGAFSWAQARHVGVTRRMIERRVDRGRWVRLARNVYADRSHPRSWQQRYHVALLAHPTGALRGVTGCHVLGLAEFGPTDPVRVTVPARTRTGSSVARCTSSSLLRPRTVQGLRVNHPSILMLEVASDAPFLLTRAYEEAILLRRVSFAAVADVAVRASAGRIAGAAELRRLLARLGDGHVPPESELERLLFALLDRAGVPAFVRQAPCPWDPTGPGRVDVYIPAWRLIIEVDGRRWHARIETLAADRERDRLARHHGVLVERFGWTEARDEPDACVRSIHTTAEAFGRVAGGGC